MALRGTLRRFSRVMWRSFLGQREIPSSKRRSILFCLQFAIMFPLLELGNTIGWWLDHLILVWLPRPTLKEPVFLIGNPRSGTTIAQRVILRDEERFFCFRTWEILFPALCQKYVLDIVGRIDAALGGFGRRLVLWYEHRKLSEFKRYHELAVFLPEEDDKLFVHLLTAADMAVIFPYGDFDRFTKMDEEVPLAEQDEVMRFYRAAVYRQAVLRGAQRTLLSKNPFFSGKVEALQRHFPDCRFIYMVRNPLDVVGSTISMARGMVQLAFRVETGPDLDETVYDIVKYFYRYPLEQLDRLPPERWMTVNYEELIRNPQETFEGIYRHFGWTISPQYRARLEEEVAAMRQHKSGHKYSLDSMAIAPERIVTDLYPIFDRFGFDTRGVVVSASNPAQSSQESMPLPSHESPQR
jgi:hypothetical protein